MICFEVKLRGKRRCVAGIGKHGVLTASVHWVGHDPEKLKEWRRDGRGKVPETEIKLRIGGLTSNRSRENVHYDWLKEDLVVGDEVTIRIVERRRRDKPSAQRTDFRRMVADQEREYVRRMAAKYGWRLVEPAQ